MTGQWIYRDALNHKCKPPVYNTDGATAGDIWRCECGLRWRVVKVNFDQREGDWLSWERYDGPVPEQKTGGVAINRPDTVLGGYRDR